MPTNFGFIGWPDVANLQLNMATMKIHIKEYQIISHANSFTWKRIGIIVVSVDGSL